MTYNYLVEMGFNITGDRCVRAMTSGRPCGAPIVERGGWIGCWECLTSGEVARRAQNLLLRIHLEQARPKRPVDDRDARPFWPEGMPL